MRVGPERISIYHVHLFTASGGQRGGFSQFSHGTVYLNLPACLLDCGRIALTIQCYTLRGNKRTRIPDRVPRIGSYSFGRNYGRCMLALPMPGVLFYLRMSSYIWQSGQRRLLTVPPSHISSRQLFVASLLSPSWRIVVLKASSAPQTSLPRLAMAVNVYPAAPSTPTNLLFCFCFC